MKNPVRRKRNDSTRDDALLKDSSPAGAREGKIARQVAHETDSPAATREDEIRKRAYSLWEKEGRPEGKHRDHWIRAEDELDARRGEVDNPPRFEALREAVREHSDAFLVKTDLEDADQREASPGTREQD
ncbi:DUF2934 domain-containing protein [Rhizobium lentis]|uniref:DUF2934 domain-containing protein n=1 Tax=Rhizobium lentis TaxID=1138194 RepID=UPI001C8392D1|nr:DUF2934 domain-containing protein [Rhizobium lentis]MBX5039123.1 DUF2934 domain-containing protein [Rhizobium lentis]MBX5052489.1 DUF2934 domain-containing protein [Rhizobium lentis]MBX5075024.1 DUF2934 domain-containing protein [Rhizobium lentis]MBX5109064.1 DUF2934 domain-containing protein [Rhizobium lentis]MBX5114331.1 DUF2934 domain-containing protein [Rhizobium lentis]